MSDHLRTWGKIVVSVGLLALLLRQVGAHNTLEHLWQIDRLDFGIALALYLAGVGLRAWRWQGLLSALGLRTAWTRLTELYFVGTFFNSMLPSGVGGDVVRAYELAKDGPGAAAAASSVLVDRASGLVTLMAMALVTLAIGLFARPGLVSPPVALVIVLVSVGTLAGMFILLGAEHLRRWLGRLPLLARLLDRPGIRRFTASFGAYRGAALARALILSSVFNFQLIATNYFLGVGLHLNVAMQSPQALYYLLFVPVIAFVLSLPISVSGLGAREAAYVALFSSVGVPADRALALSLAFYAVNLLTGLVGGVLYAVAGLRGVRHLRTGHEVAHE